MADFSNTTLSDPNLQFSAITPSRPLDTSAERDQMVANALSVGVSAAGKAAAGKSAAELSGAELSLEEVHDQADLVDQQIQQALKTEQGEVGGTLTKERVAEIKDAALSEFANSDRVLLALRDRGTISTTEARMRRTLNLKRALSNPINSLFRKDFLNAAADLTGGGSTDDLFQLTPEEKEAQAIQQAEAQAKAQYEAAITKTMLETNVDRETAIASHEQLAQDQKRVNELNRLKTERALNKFEVEEYQSHSVSAVSMGNAARIAQLNQEQGGKGIDTNGITTVSREIEGQYQTMLANVQTLGLTGSDLDAEMQRLDKWKQGQNALLESYSLAKYDKAFLEELNSTAKKIMWSNVPQAMVLQAGAPQMFDLLMKSGNQLDHILDVTFGNKAGTNLMQAASDMIQDLDAFSQNKPQKNPDAVPRLLDSEEGQKIVAEEAGKPGSKVSEALKSAYLEAPEASLTMFTSMWSTMAAKNNPNYRAEMDAAMSITRRHIGMLNEVKGQGGLIEVKKGDTRSRWTAWQLDIPEGMQEHAGEIKQMYKIINKHPWTWAHVEADYMDAGDAFNGYMRGEWDLDVTMGEGEPGVDRLRAEDPTREGTPLEATGGPRAADVADLESAIEEEELATGAPTEAEEARLTESLEQRVEIRDQERRRGLPVDPRVERQEPALAEARPAGEPVDAISLTREYEHPEQYVSQFTIDESGKVGKARALRDGKAYPYAYYVKGTGWEVDIGYGKLIKAGIKTKAEAMKLVENTPPIPLEEATANLEQHFEKDRTAAAKKFPQLGSRERDVVAMMRYQGADVTKWPNSSKAIDKASKSDDPADWLAAQAHLLNSKWATEQTPKRALETVHMLYPDTPIETLKTMLEGFKRKRGVS